MTDSTVARRSDRTRAAILQAARERFAADGYDRATIRAIAADAGIDPSMVMRYYGSKEGLFAAAAEIDLRLPDLTSVPRAEIGARLVGHFLDLWENATGESLVILLRAATTNEAVRAELQRILATQVAPTLAAACPRPEEVPTRMGLVVTQILGLATTRFVLDLPVVAALDRATIVARLGATVQGYLTEPL
ncbi:TetR/AcrR family transcriptional regulator [Solihabitans fulvus]|uniref:TetR/AcrR family transcriptional regulator n=1 Tax=Solihabitans fulvus TaxID=1892852 RepID=A0A5B2WRD9_9PSEU|nr:TetR family transcriptional regulator [Solihabitans fulvus]KAA2254065.1 TetR/AcrR family transcriptional regulator [Solihabitans fulvus]